MRDLTWASAKVASSTIARVLLAMAMVASLAFAAAGTAGAATQTTSRTGTWVGQVERNGSHFDYVGRACPVEEEICIDILATYPIVPQTLQAWSMLPQVAGGTARLTGTLVTVGDTSKLLVRQVSKA